MTAAPTIAGAIALQYQADDDSWVTVEVHDGGSLLRTRRFAFPPGVSVTAQKWRFVRLGDDDLGADVAKIGKAGFWRETATLSAVKRWSFDFDAGDARYGLIVTDGNIEVHRRGARVASIPAPYASAQVRRVRRTQSRDTLLAFIHEIAPWRFGRQGAHTEWDARPVVFENIPIYDYTGLNEGGVNEVQQLQFFTYTAGDTFNLTVEDQTTGTITYSETGATLAASIQSALLALSNIEAGGVSVVSTGTNTVQVTFQGQQAGGADWPEIAVGTLSSTDEGYVRVATVTQGKAGGEPVISDTRGWPGCGVFYGQRLWLGGLASRPDALLASRSGLYFDFKVGTGKGIDVSLDTDESTTILDFFPGSRLQIFAETGIFFARDQQAPPTLARAGKDGMEPGTPILDLDGEALFVMAGGQTVARTLYDDSRERYVVEPLTVFSTHLASGIVAGGMRRRRSIEEPNLSLFVRADGGATVMSSMLDQDVLGFVPWTTDGAFVEAGGELAGDVYVVTRRTAEGVETQRLERVDQTRMLDASVVAEGPCETITGLGHLEGRTVALYVDGTDAGDAVVTDGAVTLPWPAERRSEAGLLFEPRARILPIVLQQDPRAGASMHARVGELSFRLGPTASLHAGMAGKRMWPVALKRRDTAALGGTGTALLDQGPGEDAFSGWTRLFPLPGFQADAQIEFVQYRPGPLEVQEIVCNVGS